MKAKFHHMKTRPITIKARFNDANKMTTNPNQSLPVHDQALPLGKDSAYPKAYRPDVLYPIARAQSRSAIRGFAQASKDASALPFIGWDLWRAYELSWLQPGGLPAVGILKIWVPCESPCIVESKSLKLYLNGLNHTTFEDTDALLACVQKDLDAATGSTVRLRLVLPTAFEQEPIEETTFGCLDNQTLEIEHYQPHAALLANSTAHTVVSEQLFSRLLKSNCPVTNQPDWATLHIHYHGRQIDPAALLRYIVSYRDHQGFHEQCVEQIYCDVMAYCQPTSLCVFARYTRRGGLDINPWRATPGTPAPNLLRSAQQ